LAYFAPYPTKKPPGGGFFVEMVGAWICLPVKNLTVFSSRPALAVFAFRGFARSNKNIAPGFKSGHNTKQLVLLHTHFSKTKTAFRQFLF